MSQITDPNGRQNGEVPDPSCFRGGMARGAASIGPLAQEGGLFGRRLFEREELVPDGQTARADRAVP